MRFKNKLSHQIIKPTEEIERVVRQFNTWRIDRKKRERIPDYLWAEAVNLCKDYSVHQIVQLLHLNYQSLKKRVHLVKDRNSQSRKRKTPGVKSSIKFVDLRLPSQDLSSLQSPSNKISIEIQKVDGTYIKMSISESSNIEIPDIVSSFLMNKSL